MKKTSKLILILFAVLLITSCGNAEDAAVTEQTGEISAESGTVPGTDAEAADTGAGSEVIAENAEESEMPESEKGEDMRSEETDRKEASVLLYQGHASVRISTPEGKTIYVDPFMGDGYDIPADLILITHGHYDHTKTDRIGTKNADCETITWKEALQDGVHCSFDLGYVKVEAVEAGYNANHNAANCVGYILTFSNGATLYLSGDTSTTPQMKELAERDLDYAFFCCDGVYNMDMNEAISCALLVGAKNSIPYHMIPADNGNGFDADVAARFDVPGSMILKPGEELILE